MKKLTLKNGVVYPVVVNQSMDQYLIEFYDYLMFNAANSQMTDINLSEHRISTDETGDVEVIKDKTVLSVSTVTVDSKIRATFCIGNIDNTKKKLGEAEAEIQSLKLILNQQQEVINAQASINEQQDLMVLELFESLS